MLFVAKLLKWLKISHNQTCVILSTTQEVFAQVVMLCIVIAVCVQRFWKFRLQMTWEHGLWFSGSLRQEFCVIKLVLQDPYPPHGLAVYKYRDQNRDVSGLSQEWRG